METKKALWLLFTLIFLLSSCSKPLRLEKPLSFKKSTNETIQKEIQEISVEDKGKDKIGEPEPIALPSYLSKESPKVAPSAEKPKEKQPIDYKSLVGIKEPTLLNVERMPLNEFIVYALGELLKVPFLMDENVLQMTTPVTLRLPKPLNPEEILEAIVQHLESLGLEVSQKGKVLSIAKPKPAPVPPTIKQVFIGNNTYEVPHKIAQFFPLKYIKIDEIQVLMNDLTKDLKVEIKPYRRENAFLILGLGHQVKQVVEMLNLLDIPYFSEKKLYFYKTTFWQVEEFVKELSTVLAQLGYSTAKSINEPGLLFIPIKSLNSVIMAFPDEKSLSFTLEWIKKLDSPEAAGQELKFFIYKPLYSKASDLVEPLGKLFSIQHTTSKTPTQTTPSRTPSPRTFPRTPEPFPPSPPPSPSPSPFPSPQASPSSLSTTSQNINIIADEKRNLLLISCTPAQYQLVLRMLKELDKPPKQVLIEATILELTLKDELKLGLKWYLENRLTKGNYTLEQIFGVPTSSGFTFTFLTDSQRFNLLINAFASKGLTNILSTPRLMVLDNQAANIQVGTDIPVVTGEVTTAQAAGAEPGVVRSIQYRNTGVILNVKPTIYTEGLLQLEITQEVSEMGASPPGISSPTILVRKINTNVIAGDGQTIVLGGLISNTQGKEESKVPFLGDIPLLGNLFKSQSKEERKTELIVLLTPYIINTLEEAKSVTEEIKARLKWIK